MWPTPSWLGESPRALLPLPGTTILEALLTELGTAFGGCIVISAASDGARAVREVVQRGLGAQKVRLVEQSLPRGAAGCIKACEAGFRTDAIFVADAAVWLEDDPEWMLRQHQEQGNALTVFCTRRACGGRAFRNGRIEPVGLYCCDRVVLDFVSDRGYQDLKEQLVPRLRRAGLRVGAVVLPGQTREVVDWATYLHALERSLHSSRLRDRGFRQLAPGVWCGDSVDIDDRARVVGPAFLGSGCTLDAGSVVAGPAFLGDGSHIGSRAWLERVVAPRCVRIEAGTTLTDELLWDPVRRLEAGSAGFAEDWAGVDATATLTDPPSPRPTAPRSPATSLAGALASPTAAVLGIVSLFIWAFRHTFSDLWHVWQTDADYGAGQLVPVVAAYMVFARKDCLKDLRIEFSLGGLIVFGMGLTVNLLGCSFLYSSLQNLGLVVCANGLAMTLLGWQGYRRVWYPLVFLLLMLPLPGGVHDAVMLPLQGFSAVISGGILEVVGVPVVRYGHVLEVGQRQIAVAEACNGLRMALAFILVAGSVAYLVRRPGWQRGVLLLSSIPIAITCNVVRIVLAACLYRAGYEWLAAGTVHDLAGLLMMPAALCLMFLELWLLTGLTRSVSEVKRFGAVSADLASVPSRGTLG